MFLPDDFAISLMCARRDVCLDVFKPTFQKFRQRRLVRLQIGPGIDAGDKTRAFDLRFPLCPLELVPFALALPGLGIARVQNDCPVGRVERSRMWPFMACPLSCWQLSLQNRNASSFVEWDAKGFASLRHGIGPGTGRNAHPRRRFGHRRQQCEDRTGDDETVPFRRHVFQLVGWDTNFRSELLRRFGGYEFSCRGQSF